MDVRFQRNVADNSVDAGQFVRDLLNARPRAGDECHPCATLEQFRTSASPSPDVPPEIATRKPLNRSLEPECEHSSIVPVPMLNRIRNLVTSLQARSSYKLK